MIQKAYNNQHLEVNDLIEFVYPHNGYNENFNPVYFSPSDTGIIVEIFHTPRGTLCEILCGGDVMVDVPIEKIAITNIS